jgi:hypothetical protein
VRDTAWEIVKEYERSGRVSSDSEAASGFGEWNRLTPAWILFAALKLEVLARQDSGDPPERIADDLGRSLPGDTGLRLVRAAMGDMEEIRRPREQSVVTLPNLLAMVSAAWAAGGVTEADVDFRLTAAEEIAADSVRLMTGAPGMGRGRDTGPWDISEIADASVGRVDLGGLFVPVGTGVRLDPVYARAGGPPVAITLFGQGSALQLQAYRAVPGRSWDAVRAQLRRSVVSSGGTAQEWAGAAGFELRARQPVADDRGVVDVRFAGCDGPGWLLRAMITGRGAEPGSIENWAYDVFGDTVVNAGFATDTGVDFVPLRWPPEA